ncbi:hypothetical protein BJX96DRAFT_176086 [Aspergillus floccosus]
MRRRHALRALYALSLLPTTFAWTFVWHNAQNNSFVESGSSDYPCTQVANPEGMAFEYDSEEDPTTIYLYGNNNCAGTPGGQADHYLAKDAGNFIGSFRIVDRTKTASSSVSATPTVTSTATASSTQSATTGTGSAAQTTSTADAATAEGGSSLSGGAIAGVVVGVVAGVALIAAVVFFLVRRRRRSAAAAAAAGAVGAGSAESGTPTLVQSPAMQEYKDPLKEPPQTQSKPPQVVELAGDSLVEMSDSHRVNELEDNSQRIHP